MVLWLIAPFHNKARAMIQGRKNWRIKLSKDFENIDTEVVWFHCASLGEFEQGRPIIERYNKEFPHHKILLTFFSPSGYEIRKDYPLAYAVHYLPWDTSSNLETAFQLVKPVAVFIIKYEFWLHLINQGRKLGIPVMVCSAIFRREQVFFRSYGGIFRNMLKQLDQIFVQDQSSKKLLETIGISSVTVCGDTRVDRVVAISKQSTTNEVVEKFSDGKDVFVIGSSWPQDIEVLIDLINHEHELKFIIAPHEINEQDINTMEALIARPTIRYTQYNDTHKVGVLIIDTIGVLSHVYRYGKYAYIGGAFGKGLHNTLEAATFGLPLFFGNQNYEKFAEARALVSSGGAIAIGNSNELQESYEMFKRDPIKWSQASQACLEYIHNNTGATSTIIDWVKSRFSN